MDEIQQLELTLTPSTIIRSASDVWASIVQQLSPLLQQDLTPTELALIHDFTEQGKKSLDAFSELSRNRLLALVKEKGQIVTDNGTLELPLGNGRVQRAIPMSTKPNDKLTEKMLKGRNLPLTSGMDTDVKYKANDTKLCALRQTNAITEDDYLSCFPERQYRLGKTVMKDEENND